MESDSNTTFSTYGQAADAGRKAIEEYRRQSTRLENLVADTRGKRKAVNKSLAEEIEALAEIALLDSEELSVRVAIDTFGASRLNGIRMQRGIEKERIQTRIKEIDSDPRVATPQVYLHSKNGKYSMAIEAHRKELEDLNVYLNSYDNYNFLAIVDRERPSVWPAVWNIFSLLGWLWHRAWVRRSFEKPLAALKADYRGYKDQNSFVDTQLFEVRAKKQELEALVAERQSLQKELRSFDGEIIKQLRGTLKSALRIGKPSVAVPLVLFDSTSARSSCSARKWRSSIVWRPSLLRRSRGSTRPRGP